MKETTIEHKLFLFSKEDYLFNKNHHLYTVSKGGTSRRTVHLSSEAETQIVKIQKKRKVATVKPEMKVEKKQRIVKAKTEPTVIQLL